MASRRHFLAASAGVAGATALGAAAPAAADPPPAQPAAVFFDGYAGKGGTPRRSDSGSTYSYTGGLTMAVTNGALGLGADSADRALPAAAYQQADLGAPITFIGAYFVLDDAQGTRSTHGSGVLLGGFAGPLVDATTVSAGIHVVIGIDYWGYYVIDSGTPVVLGNGPFAPLSTDAIHYADVSIAGTTATVRTPDGGTHTVSDPRIGSLGRSWLTTEIVLSAPSDIQGAYTALQAGT